MEHAPEPQASLLPNAEALLELERRSRSLGTGLEAKELLGAWQLVQTWPKGQNEPAAASAWLLRSLAAQLRIEAGPSPGQLRLANRVSLGALSLEFSGQGQLKGRRPLLCSSLNGCSCSWAASSCSIGPSPNPNRPSFPSLP